MGKDRRRHFSAKHRALAILVGVAVFFAAYDQAALHYHLLSIGIDSNYDALPRLLAVGDAVAALAFLAFSFFVPKLRPLRALEAAAWMALGDLIVRTPVWSYGKDGEGSPLGLGDLVSTAFGALPTALYLWLALTLGLLIFGWIADRLRVVARSRRPSTTT